MARLRIPFLQLALILVLTFFAAPALAAANNPVPLINSLSPTAAAPAGAAFTLTVLGTNFVSTSVVNWNGSPRTTTMVNSTTLTASITSADIASAGTTTISVTNPTPGGGVSNQVFFAITPPASRISFSTNNITNQVAITSNVVEGDFNNDGKLDVAVALGPTVFVLLGNGDGTFQSAIGTAGVSGTTINGLYVADANSDCKLDLFAAGTNGSSNVLLTFYGKGDGTFNPPVQTIFAGTNPSYGAMVFADFNQDGILDAALTANNTDVVVLFGNSDGTFSPGTVTAVNSPSGSAYGLIGVLAAADFTGQGQLSLVVQIEDRNTMVDEFPAILTGTGGTFNPTPISFENEVGSDETQGIATVVGDFNGDGNLDLAVLRTGASLGAVSELFVLLNAGNTSTPTFAAPYTVPAPTAFGKSQPANLISGDFNGDGKLDLAAGGLIFFGQGDGTFPTSTGVVSEPFLLAGDFNDDGKTDIIRDDPSSGENPALGMLLQIPPSPDFIGGVSPSTVAASLNNTSDVTITLHALFGFSSDVTLSVSGLPAGITATFSPATVTGGNGTSTLALAVGSSVTLGSYSVTITGTGGGITHSSTFTLLVNSSPGSFAGSVSPDTQNIVAGKSATFSVTITPTGGFNGSVVLSLSGSLPAGSTYSFNPATITGGSGTSTLTVSTPTGLPASVTYLTIMAVSGTISLSHTVALGVNPTSGDFTGTYTGSATSGPTGTAEYAFYLQPVNGYTQPVTITFSGLPAGATSSGPINVTPGSAGAVYITLSNVAPGTYPLLVTLAAPGVVHEVTVQLVVTP